MTRNRQCYQHRRRYHHYRRHRPNKPAHLQLVDLGMSLTDLPDSDFDLLDKDKSGLISVEEFSEFLQVTLNPKVKLNKASVTAN